MWYAILGAGGVTGIVAVAIMAFVVHRSLIARGDRDADDRRDAQKALTRTEIESASLRETIAVLTKNGEARDRQIVDLDNNVRLLTARAAAAETTNNDLLTALEASHASGALPLALRAELDRLRALVSAGAQATPSSATGDPSGGEDGAMHGGPEVHSPR